MPRDEVARETGILGKHRGEQMERLDGLVRRHAAFGARDDAADARGHENAVPEAIVARPERKAYVGEQIRSHEPALRKERIDRGIVLFDERE